MSDVEIVIETISNEVSDFPIFLDSLTDDQLIKNDVDEIILMYWEWKKEKRTNDSNN